MKKYTALICDIKNSKKIKNREEIQNKLKNMLNYINKEYNEYIESKFTITLGDEFQCLFNDASVVIDVIEYIKQEFDVSVRFGIGIGFITTTINKEIAIGADGPAYHYAREAINNAKASESKHCTFASDVKIKLEDSYNEEVINTMLALLGSINSNRTPSQKRIIKHMKDGMTQKELGKIVNLDQSTIQRSFEKSSYYQYIDGLKVVKKIMKELGE